MLQGSGCRQYLDQPETNGDVPSHDRQQSLYLCGGGLDIEHGLAHAMSTSNHSPGPGRTVSTRSGLPCFSADECQRQCRHGTRAFSHTDHEKPIEMVATASKKVTARDMLDPQQTARPACSLSCTTESDRCVSTTRRARVSSLSCPCSCLTLPSYVNML